MNKTIKDNNEVSDIDFDVDEGKHILDSSDKIIRWIKHRINEQESKRNETFPNYRYIDLSHCIISTPLHNGEPSMTNLCDIVKESERTKMLDYFINDNPENDYHQEVQKAFICKNSIIYSAFFHRTKFHEDVDFEGSEFIGNASFSGCSFGKYANFQATKYSGGFNFESCIFNGVVLFHKAKFESAQITFRNSVFKDRVNANEIEFDNDTNENNDQSYISFKSAQFNDSLLLSNIYFTRNCFFNKARFDGNVEFINTCFRSKLLFDDSIIDGSILFSVDFDEQKESKSVVRNNINKISFRRSKITGRVDIERVSICKLEGFFANIRENATVRIYDSIINIVDFTSICNRGTLIFEDNKEGIDKLTLKSAINFGVIEAENTNIKNITDRRTARILKDSSNKYGNAIDALEFRQTEMDLLKKERKEKKKGFDFPLWLNGISNNHGTSWFRALIFTVFCWIGFYSLFLVTTRTNEIYAFFNNQSVTWTFSNDISNAIKYLWSLDFLDTLSDWVNQIDFDNFWWTSILKVVQLIFASFFFIFGKIAIGYGIYQTIAAFRKYGK